MAYADIGQKRPFNPASFGGAMLVNGGLLALIVFAAPHIIRTIPEKPVDMIRVSSKPIVDEARPTKRASDHRAAVATPVAQDPSTPVDLGDVRAFSDLTDALPTGPILPPGGGGGLTLTIHNPAHLVAMVHPNYRSQLQPAYPPGLARLGIEGVATVRVLVGTDGRVKAVESVRSNEEEFMAATRDQALRRWRFKPATDDGVPVDSWREMTVRFVMPD